MNTLLILFVFPLLIVFSYLFDRFARKTKFPAVILLMFTGILFRLLSSAYGFNQLGFLDDLIPVLGTVGLILIVLEGALELKISNEKLPLLLKGFIAALVILLLNIAALQWVFSSLFEMSAQVAVLSAIPLAIISSAVAIPSAGGLLDKEREFVVYESTFSDILGIMIFNYALRQFEVGEGLLNSSSLVALLFQIIGVVVISIGITYILFKLLRQIEHHVKFFLILALLILVYAFGKLFHLPALVTIFIFGIFLSNVKSLLPRFLKNYLDLDHTEKELHEFHLLTAESTFLVRTFFFLFFGFSIQLSTFNSIQPLIYGVIIILIMLALRYLYFSATTVQIKPSPLVYLSPRGLISILLFLQLKDISFVDLSLSPIDERVLLIVILGTMLVMLLGTLKKFKASQREDFAEDESPITVEMQLDQPHTSDEETEDSLN
ncbi:MAG: cation:proton antiporter [Flavobacteriaceae bacterium]|jgi:Kef-type K+ transport system membrane component KefB